ncbi:MAG: methyltransferase domain-containing protein [Pseudomonadota bacterium]
MGLLATANANIGRARYTAAQAIRSAWYGGHYLMARRRSAGFTRPGETPFKPEHDAPERGAIRTAFLKLFADDRRNIEEGLYTAPEELSVRKLPQALRHSRAFFKDLGKVDERRVHRNGTEVRDNPSADPKKYPPYYRQNFHYQSDGWLSDDSADIYDTQVEILFGGAADAMRRAGLAEIARELKGKDQRKVNLLDVGAGTGRFLAQVMRTFPRLKGNALELSPFYAEAARETLSDWRQVGVIEGQAEKMPVEDASQDVVVSVYLFHELPHKIRLEVFKEIRRVLRRGGLFVFTDSLQFGDNPDLDAMLEYFPEGFHEPYYKEYLSADLDTALVKAGFEQERRTTAFLTKVATWRKM